MFRHRAWSVRSFITYVFINLMWQHSILYFGFDLIAAGLLIMIEDRYREFKIRND